MTIDTITNAITETLYGRGISFFKIEETGENEITVHTVTLPNKHEWNAEAEKRVNSATAFALEKLGGKLFHLTESEFRLVIKF